MIILESEQLIVADVDDTILLWNAPQKFNDAYTFFLNPYTEEWQTVRIHEPHILVLQQRLKRGATVILWSASGYLWAKAAAEACCLKGDKLVIASKPIFSMDDKPAEAWLGKPMYMDPNDKWGK